jgi:hypothetical protein
MATAHDRKCPDCGGKVEAIKLIDKSHMGVHTQMEYTVPEARRGFWMGTFPVEGKVDAFMCEQCGRIQLFGQPRR